MKVIFNIKILFFFIFFVFSNVYAGDFKVDLRKIRAEINRDNLQDAIKKIKKIKISNENEQEQIDLLFGDIYLKINQIDKAEEFYQKTFFTSNEEIEAKTFTILLLLFISFHFSIAS